MAATRWPSHTGSEVGTVGESLSSRELPPGVTVLVLGPAPEGLTRVLWGAGLRPVRARKAGMLWMVPADRGRP